MALQPKWGFGRFLLRFQDHIQLDTATRGGASLKE